MNNQSLTSGKMSRKLIKFALPLLLALFLQALYGAVDLFILGKFATDADVSAVATSSQIMEIIIVFISGLSLGVTIIVAYEYGKAKYQEIKQIFTEALRIFLILSIVLATSLIFANRFIIEQMNTPLLVQPLAKQYLTITSFGVIFIVLYNMLAGVFRGLGNSLIPLVSVAIACCLNIVGDYILVAYFNLGSVGVAYSTIFAQAVSVIICLIILKFKYQITFQYQLLKAASYSNKIIKLGLPEALKGALNQITYVIIFALINKLGIEASAGVGIGEKIILFMMMIPISLNQAVTTMVAQNRGANKYANIKQTFNFGLLISSSLGFLVMIIGCFLAKNLIAIFISNQAVIKLGADYIFACSIEMFFVYVYYIFQAYFNGFNKTNVVMYQSVLIALIVRIPLAFYFSNQAQPTVYNISLTAPISAFITLIVCLIYYVYFQNKIKHDF